MPGFASCRDRRCDGRHRTDDHFQGRAEAVVHFGDMVAPFSATPFDTDFPFYAVRGNNDGEPALGNAVREFGAYLR